KLLKNTTRTFMSPKKEHEVEILVPITNQLANMVDIDSIIDYGSVRGYLGVKYLTIMKGIFLALNQAKKYYIVVKNA
ncbi:unnamed protein product, partial [Rotaria magnacalcarata]